MVRVKVCGHTRAADVADSVDTGVDAIGVIADVPVDTPREVDADTARELLASVPPFVSGVLVTMPETAGEALDLVERVGPDALQIHAGLDIDGLREVARPIDIPLIVGTDVDDQEIGAIGAIADAVLLDSRDESGAGGTGRTHDWTRARELLERLDAPVVLAGGLTPKNVADGIREVGPYAVDVASGVEASGGVKDPRAVERFVAAVDRAEAVEA